MTRNKYTIYYLPMNIMRKVLFINIPIIFPVNLQVPLLLLMHTIYIEFYGYQRPHIRYSQFFVELMNEIAFMLVCYHMAYLTTMTETWALNNLIQYKIGSSLLIVLYIQMTINLLFAFYKVILQNVSDKKKR